MAQKTALRFMAIAVMMVGLMVAIASPTLGTTEAVRQEVLLLSQLTPPSEVPRFSLSDSWQQVYDLMPDLPLENQYISSETGEAAANSTLASRLIRYHTMIKGRPPNYRFDWKLTLADYLGANERIVAAQYPGWDTLRVDASQGDIAAVGRLSRAQRDQLVQILVSLFTTSDSNPPAPAASPSPAPEVAPSPRETFSRPTQPRSGDAQLLLP